MLSAFVSEGCGCLGRACGASGGAGRLGRLSKHSVLFGETARLAAGVLEPAWARACRWGRRGVPPAVGPCGTGARLEFAGLGRPAWWLGRSRRWRSGLGCGRRLVRALRRRGPPVFYRGRWVRCQRRGSCQVRLADDRAASPTYYKTSHMQQNHLEARAPSLYDWCNGACGVHSPVYPSSG